MGWIFFAVFCFRGWRDGLDFLRGHYREQRVIVIYVRKKITYEI